MTETCEACGATKPEPQMIYDVPNDKYFCNQDCADQYSGIEREDMSKSEAGKGDGIKGT